MRDTKVKSAEFVRSRRRRGPQRPLRGGSNVSRLTNLGRLACHAMTVEGPLIIGCSPVDFGYGKGVSLYVAAGKTG